MNDARTHKPSSTINRSRCPARSLHLRTGEMGCTRLDFIPLANKLAQHEQPAANECRRLVAERANGYMDAGASGSLVFMTSMTGVSVRKCATSRSISARDNTFLYSAMFFIAVPSGRTV